MRNYALQKGPCSFLKSRTSPWEVPFLFLLCFSSLWRLLLPNGSISLSLSLSLYCPFFPPCGSRRAGSRRLREGAGGGVRGAQRAAAARERRCAARASGRCAGERRRRVSVGGARAGRAARAAPGSGGGRWLAARRTSGRAGGVEQTRERHAGQAALEQAAPGAWWRGRR
jgi:hypothetical protein